MAEIEPPKRIHTVEVEIEVPSNEGEMGGHEEGECVHKNDGGTEKEGDGTTLNTDIQSVATTEPPSVVVDRKGGEHGEGEGKEIQGDLNVVSNLQRYCV